MAAEVPYFGIAQCYTFLKTLTVMSQGKIFGYFFLGLHMHGSADSLAGQVQSTVAVTSSFKSSGLRMAITQSIRNMPPA